VNNLNGYITASMMTHTELEEAAQKILATHSIREIMKKTPLAYGTIWNLRKTSEARKSARFTTLQVLVSAFIGE